VLSRFFLSGDWDIICGLTLTNLDDVLYWDEIHTFELFDHTGAILGWLPLIRYTWKSTQKASKQGALKNDCPNEN